MADLPGGGCKSLQPERVNDLWCGQNCGLSQFNGPAVGDACDKQFCKCPGDEEQKENARESTTPSSKQRPDGTPSQQGLPPPSSNPQCSGKDGACGKEEEDGVAGIPERPDQVWDEGSFTDLPPPSVNPGSNPGANTTQQPQPGWITGDPSPGAQTKPAPAEAPVPSPAPAEQPAVQPAEQPTGCCASNADAQYCWGCGNDGHGWCHSGKDACDPKCNGTWMATVTTPDCQGAIDANGPGGASAATSLSRSVADSEFSLQSVKGDAEKAQRQAIKDEAQREHEKQVAINEAEKQRQRDSAEEAHRVAKEARAEAETQRRDVHNELKAQRQATKDGSAPAHSNYSYLAAPVAVAPVAAVEVARREAEAALVAARGEAEEAHRLAEVHRREFEAVLDKRKEQRETAAAQKQTEKEMEAAHSYLVAPAAVAPAAAAPGVNSYGETVPSPEALRALLAAAHKAKPS